MTGSDISTNSKLAESIGDAATHPSRIVRCLLLRFPVLAAPPALLRPSREL